MSITLAAVQFRPPKGQTAAAREALAGLLRSALDQGARFVVCPEMATTGYVWDSPEQIAPHAEPEDGPTRAMLEPLARQYGAWIVCGFAEQAEDGLYNSALVVGPHGLSVCYRKVLLYDADKTWARPGKRRLLIETEHGLVAPGICMDLNDDGFTGLLRQEQPRICAFCTNWVEEGEDILPYWRWRLAGWRGYFVAADCWGEDGSIRFYGRSAILGPRGEVLAMAAPEGDTVLLAELPAPGT